MISYRPNERPTLIGLADANLTNAGWLSCQINETDLFQLLCYWTVKARKLCRKLSLLNNKFVASTLPDRNSDIASPSLCFVKAKMKIAVIGGYRYALFGKSHYSTVELFDLENETWSSMPDLNVARNEHSSCYHGGYIYVLGGKTNDVWSTNSIERFHFDHAPRPSAWEQFTPTVSQLLTTTYPALFSLNDTELIFFGGYEEKSAVTKITTGNKSSNGCKCFSEHSLSSPFSLRG